MSKDTKHINDIFHGRIFRIPDYQRGYAWEEKHRQAFWEDLELLLEIKGETKHYTGLIALESLTRIIGYFQGKMNSSWLWMDSNVSQR